MWECGGQWLCGVCPCKKSSRRWLGTSCMECNPGASLSLALVQGTTVHGSGGGAISADH